MLIGRESSGGCIRFFGAVEDGSMRDHDLVSGSLLALTVVGIALLCSSLLAFALI